MRVKKGSAVFVFNDQGYLALQMRAAHDENYPSHWDFSVGGGSEPGETFEQTAIREMREEIGIIGAVKFISQGIYREGDFEEILYIYKTVHNGPFNPDPNEVEKIEFFPIEKIEEMIGNNEPFHPEFLYFWGQGVLK